VETVLLRNPQLVETYSTPGGMRGRVYEDDGQRIVLLDKEPVAATGTDAYRQALSDFLVAGENRSLTGSFSHPGPGRFMPFSSSPSRGPGPFAWIFGR
jgi:hypothetical protein